MGFLTYLHGFQVNIHLFTKETALITLVYELSEDNQQNIPIWLILLAEIKCFPRFIKKNFLLLNLRLSSKNSTSFHSYDQPN